MVQRLCRCAVLTEPFKPTDAIKAIVGIGRTVLGGHLLFGFDWYYNMMHRLFPVKIIYEERFLGLSLSPVTRITCLIATIVALLSGLVVAGSLLLPGQGAVIEQREVRRRFRALDVFTAVILIGQYLFNMIWEPTNDEFWIGVVPIACIGMAAVFARRRVGCQRIAAGAVFAGALLGANGLGSILPQTHLESDYWYHVNRFLIENARKEDTIVTDGGFISDTYLKLYTGAHVHSVRRGTLEQLKEVLSGTQEGRAWISSWAFEPPKEVVATGIFAKEKFDESAIQSVLGQIKGRLVKRSEIPEQTVWELPPASVGHGARSDRSDGSDRSGVAAGRPLP